MMFQIRELRKDILESKSGNPLISGLKEIFKKLEQGGETVVPQSFLSAVFMAFPQFKEREHNGYKQ